MGAMAHHDVNPKDFEGKTIARLEASCVNVIRFFFTDGTAIAIEVDAVGIGIYGMVQCDVCVEPPTKAKVGRSRR